MVESEIIRYADNGSSLGIIFSKLPLCPPYT